MTERKTNDGGTLICLECGDKLTNEALNVGRDFCFECYCEQNDKLMADALPPPCLHG